MSSDEIDKALLLESLIESIDGELRAVARSQREAMSAAVHPEARAEHAKDTRATETSYLARGLAKRVSELELALRELRQLELRRFSADDTIGLSALVAVEDNRESRVWYWLVPAGPGQELMASGVTVRTITPQAPLGRALIGRSLGDTVELRSRSGMRDLTVVSTL